MKLVKEGNVAEFLRIERDDGTCVVMFEISPGDSSVSAMCGGAYSDVLMNKLDLLQITTTLMGMYERVYCNGEPQQWTKPTSWEVGRKEK